MKPGPPGEGDRPRTAPSAGSGPPARAERPDRPPPPRGPTWGSAPSPVGGTATRGTGTRVPVPPTQCKLAGVGRSGDSEGTRGAQKPNSPFGGPLPWQRGVGR